MKGSQISPQAEPGFRVLARAVVVAAALIFAGLSFVAVSVLGQNIGESALSIFADRAVYYVLIVLIVGYYVYTQRR